MTYVGLVKTAKLHFENCNNGPEETPVQGDCSYILTPRATGPARPSPAGPECKKNDLLILFHVMCKYILCTHIDKNGRLQISSHLGL